MLSIGENAFRIIGISFIPAVFFSNQPGIFPGHWLFWTKCIAISNTADFLPDSDLLGFIFMGLEYTWFAFPIAEIVTGSVGWLLYRRKLKQWNFYDEKQTEINKGTFV